MSSFSNLLAQPSLLLGRGRELRTGLLTLLLAALVGSAVPTSARAQTLRIKLVSLTSPAGRGSDASITIQTIPGASCDITVFYKSGPSTAAGLYPQRADNRGLVTWIWRVGTRTTPGRWPIVVNCSSGGRQGTLEVSFLRESSRPPSAPPSSGRKPGRPPGLRRRSLLSGRRE